MARDASDILILAMPVEGVSGLFLIAVRPTR